MSMHAKHSIIELACGTRFWLHIFLLLLTGYIKETKTAEDKEMEDLNKKAQNLLSPDSGANSKITESYKATVKFTSE